MRLSIVIPCFNEAPGIPSLSSRLWPALERFRGLGDVEVIVVDDGSRDATCDVVRETLMTHPGVRLVHHPTNRGITAAIATGTAAARGSIVCTLDADGSYDPRIVGDLVEPILAARADVVTASPYHPRGQVVDVPRWRLILSRAASWLYRLVLPVPLHTYTSCCRAYRRSVAPRLAFRHPGFLGVTEMLVSAILAGCRVVEVPAVLERRRHGVSKMRTARVLWGHLGLLARLATGRPPLAPEAAHGPR
jgi:dolichol-phosphate mannosyltransferase